MFYSSLLSHECFIKASTVAPAFSFQTCTLLWSISVNTTQMNVDHKRASVGVFLDYQLIAFKYQINCRFIVYIPPGI